MIVVVEIGTDHVITHLIILVVEDVSHMNIRFIILVGVKGSHEVDPHIVFQ